MAKYNWIELEKEFILGDYKSLNAFLREKGIPKNGATQKKTKGWGTKKSTKELQKSSKTIEKVIEKESTKEANEIVSLNSVASKILNRIEKVSTEVNNPQGLKSLASALRDIKELLNEDNPDKKQATIIVDDCPYIDDE